jgi:glutaconate CoA-transferase subunit A
VTSLADAVARYAPDGSTVYLGNFGGQLFSVGHELIRQGRQDLHAVMGSGGLLLDQLLGAGVVAEATYAHCWSPVGPDPAWNFRRRAASIIRHEVTLGLLAAALTAGAWGLPFLPVPDLAGTGYVDENWTGGMLDVATSTRFGASPVIQALRPDTAFVHVDLVDADGNGLILAPVGETVVAAQAARTVVLVAEEAVATLPAPATVPGLLTSAVVVRPGAVRPDGAVGRYERDVAAYQAYVAAASTVEGFVQWRNSL